jgi:hypothetical protein
VAREYADGGFVTFAGCRVHIRSLARDSRTTALDEKRKRRSRSPTREVASSL